MNPLLVIEGHVNKALRNTPLADTEVEKLAEMRMSLCHACVRKANKCLSEDNRCCICHCDMEAKTRALKSVCPIGRW